MSNKRGKFEYFNFDTEQEAKDFKKKNRWRKGTISYSEYWGCWILARTIKK